jgi:transcriptional regulator of acetoin/glycerol metabolism
LPEAGTVVLRDLADLDRGEQHALLHWLDVQGGRVQVISVAPTPLFPLVAGGDFSEALFYRLNMVVIHAANQQPASALTGLSDSLHFRRSASPHL